MSFCLTGDIGGTNSRMAFYSIDENGETKLLVSNTYNNEKTIKLPITETVYLDSVIKPFLEDFCFQKIANSQDCTIIACLACAGPVINNSVAMSNIKESVDDQQVVVDGKQIEESIPQIVRCSIINDFVAQGYGCLTLKKEECRHLNGPELTNFNDVKSGPKVCVGAGTGLGECFLTPNGSNYSCYPSEGGHVSYTPCSLNHLDTEKLWKYTCNKFKTNRHSVERVVSGIGLANVYEFLSTEYPDKVDKKIHEEFEKATDMKAKVVAVNVENNELCQQSMDILMHAYGSEVGNAAIKFIPTGGLFVSGGLTPKNIQHITKEGSEFMKEYVNKGRAAVVLKQIPLYAVMEEDLGVRGALQCAKTERERYLSEKK